VAREVIGIIVNFPVSIAMDELSLASAPGVMVMQA
jgi:hypothetical protein